MERAKFDIEKLQGEVKELKEEMHDVQEDVRDLREFKVSAVEKFLTIMTQLKDLQEGDKWIKRLIVGSLITSSLGGIVALVVWAIQN